MQATECFATVPTRRFPSTDKSCAPELSSSNRESCEFDGQFLICAQRTLGHLLEGNSRSLNTRFHKSPSRSLNNQYANMATVNTPKRCRSRVSRGTPARAEPHRPRPQSSKVCETSPFERNAPWRHASGNLPYPTGIAASCFNTSQILGYSPVRPNPSLNRSANGRPPRPGRRYAVHFRRPGRGGLPLSPG
jgi:hypothetical protein